MAYGRRGIGDLVPAAGEARVLAEVKGRYGKMKSVKGRRSRFSAMRQGRISRKPQFWIPLGAGTPGTSNRPDQKWLNRVTPGSSDENVPDMGILWAITPELSGTGHNVVSVLPVGGEADADMRYRVVGIQGKLFWTPLVSYDTGGGTDLPAEPTASYSGYIRVVWTKLRAQPDSGGSGNAEYPWEAGFDLDSEVGPTRCIPYFPYYNAVTIQTAPTQTITLRNRDGRYRNDIMRHYEKSWQLPLTTVWDNANGTVAYFPVAARPIEIPLPRKLVCDVGQGEALVCMYQVVSNSGIAVGSSPGGVFHFGSVRVKCFAHI